MLINPFPSIIIYQYFSAQMKEANKSRLYLIGFMGVGKTTIGRQLAAKLGYDFVDLDDVFEQKYKLSIERFFAKYGEELFRQLESELLKSTFKMEKVIIASGGGTACNFDGIGLMNNNGLTIYLEMAAKALVHRLTHAKRKRPLVADLAQDDLFQAVQSRLEQRLPYYNQAKIKTDALDFDLDLLLKQINQFK